TLNVPNAALSGLGTGGSNTFGTVSASVNTTTQVLTVTFTMDASYFIKSNTSGNGSVGFQVTGTGLTLGSISGTDGNGNTYTPLAATLTTKNSIPVPGTSGTYNVLVDLGNPVSVTKCTGRPGHQTCTTTTTTEGITPGLVTLTFTVNGVTALDPAMFFAHVVTSSLDGSGNRITGFVGNGVETPEPASLFLMGTGLLGFGSAVRRRFKS
ncbi:MAG TPA: PEP-CTERM sorting domain-containing protein, partial [Terriglobales bacterium]|nr:PEP-CTERM sorting domain-containing protein [Terriglobales bacterium]